MNGRAEVIQEWKHTAGYVPSILSRALPPYQIREPRQRFPHEAGQRRDDPAVGTMDSAQVESGTVVSFIAHFGAVTTS